MKEQMLELLNRSSTTVSTTEILCNFAVAVALGLVIFISYRTSHTRVVYSARFNVSLLMLTVITTLVMSVIGNNIALSLGMVGALSIVRFRTAIKDSRDTAYIFWSIAIGICCGVADYKIAVIGSVCIFVILLAFGLVQDNQRYLLVVRASRENETEVMNIVKEFYKGKAVLKVSNSTKETSEFIYEISNKLIKKTSKNGKITDVLYEQGKADSVNLVCQNQEI